MWIIVLKTFANDGKTEIFMLIRCVIEWSLHEIKEIIIVQHMQTYSNFLPHEDNGLKIGCNLDFVHIQMSLLFPQSA